MGDDNSLKFYCFFVNKHEDVWGLFNFVKRDSKIVNEKQETIFEQKGVIFPDTWSQLAVDITTSKYFRGTLKRPDREYSIQQLIGRVTDKITEWGLEQNYFDTENAEIFKKELVFILLNQMASFNSPVWFNLGASKEPMVSACYIQPVEDNMESIMDLAKSEAMLFKGGSGSGTNFSTLRSSREPLSGGGTASGPISFMRGFDSFAGVVKSGGKCFPGYQYIYTENGPIKVKDLVNKKFVVFSYDPPTNRIKAKHANAWKSGNKKVLEIITDKGIFHMSEDHPVRLSTGEARQVKDLKKGNSIHKASVDLFMERYLRIGLQDGKKGKELLHRLISQDILKIDKALHVHHKDNNSINNSLDNLQSLSHGEHSHLHMKKLVEKNEHYFQKNKHPKKGEKNGMHHNSEFWKNNRKVEKYKKIQKDILLKNPNRPIEMQKLSSKKKMINFAFKLLNNNLPIDTFENYINSRKKISYNITNKQTIEIKNNIKKYFGSYENFLQEINDNNHQVLEIREIGYMDVYSVEVECSTLDDKSKDSGHNFMIWSLDNKTKIGSGIFVFNTRRAAKLVVLNVDHPDIMDFINCKKLEEQKAYDLIDLGYDGSIDGEAYNTVQYQNANNSVRVNDEFMNAVVKNEKWTTFSRTTAKPIETLNARDILEEIAKSTHFCGDPGMQFDSKINEWHTCKNSGRINCGNPCSEFMFLDNSACNLASINLLKFLKEDQSFDYDKFKYVVKVMITAQDIMVDMANYPTEKIKENSIKYRPLGLGYANLGALLMSKGYPYDSDEGRSYAAHITSLMTAQAYKQSAKIAEVKGAFIEYEKNKKPMIEVIVNHTNANENISNYGNISDQIWLEAYQLGKEYGYRNSQVTLLAPTGTIAFMMDCDTTGIEPDMSLVKYKKLVGGGYLKLVNNSVERALRNLKYTGSNIKYIKNYIELNGTVENSILQEKHLPIFDCSLKVKGFNRRINPIGHIKMMAAVQPFLSGSISKTVNVDEDVTAEEIKDIYIKSWQLGVKAIAIYREGSKRVQPLNNKEDDKKEKKSIINTDDIQKMITEKAEKLAKELIEKNPRAKRNKMPDERNSLTHKFAIAGHKGYLTVGMYENGQPGEIFIRMAKAGSVVNGLVDGLALAVSLCLQYGVPLQVLVDKYSHTRFEPSGFTKNQNIPIAKSILDYVFRWLEFKFIKENKKENEKICIENNTIKDIQFESSQSQISQSSPTCMTCGSLTQRNGACYICPSCGTSTGCS